MRQTLHIFGKDVRQFWKEIVLVIAVTSLFAAVGVRRAIGPDSLEMAWSSSMVLLPISWWLLISRLIHAEALPGTRSYWMTRPYSWLSLLTAKFLLVVVFINVPLFIGDTVILQANGFQLVSALPGLLFRQAMISVAFLVPSAALAVLTTSIVQILLAVLAIAVGSVVFVLWNSAVFYTPFSAFDWLHWLLCAVLVAVSSVVIIVLQYWKRRSSVSFALGLLSLLAVGLLAAHAPWLWILNMQSRFSAERFRESEVALRLNSGLAFASRAVFQKGDQVDIEVPIELIAPSKVTGRIDSFGFYIKANDGTGMQFLSVFPIDGEPKLRATVPGWFYRKIRNEPLRIEGRAYVTLFRSTLTTILPSKKDAAIPGGRCSVDSSDDRRTYFLHCTSPLRAGHERRVVRMQVAVDGRTEYVIPGNQYQVTSYSPLPADFDLDPVTRREYVAAYQPPFWKEQSQLSQPEFKAVEVTTLEPVAHMWTDFEITGPRLSGHEVNMLN